MPHVVPYKSLFEKIYWALYKKYYTQYLRITRNVSFVLFNSCVIKKDYNETA
jgi:hypothetical protein